MRMQMFAVLSSLVCASAALAAEPIRALIITGHNNHNWEYTSRVHKDTLEATGKFVVDITDDPAKTLADAPGIAKYQVFVLDYNDWGSPKRWGEPAESNFVAAVRGGTGVSCIHSANNAFKGWKEYEEMVGLLWRDGTGHGPFHEFNVEIVDAEHPITKGLSTIERHADELYHRLVNVRETRPRLLMRALDNIDKGSGQFEPMAFTLEYGKGRVFCTPLGHVWKGDQKSKHTVVSPPLRTLIARGTEWAATGAVTIGTQWTDTRTPAALTDAQKKDGWVHLFDGSEASAKANFREYKAKAWPSKGWVVRDGAIVHEKGNEGGDLVTMGQYGDFEFECQWKISKGGNSGIIYRADENHGAAYETGPEMQVLDDEGHATANAKHKAGSMYDLIGCSADVSRPAGEWNTAKIRVQGTRHTYWLNGIKVVDVDTSTEEFKKVQAASKWKDYKDFGTLSKGHIDLQNHGDEVWYRDIKVREIR